MKLRQWMLLAIGVLVAAMIGAMGCSLVGSGHKPANDHSAYNR
jgi:hypothetical protein